MVGAAGEGMNLFNMLEDGEVGFCPCVPRGVGMFLRLLTKFPHPLSILNGNSRRSALSE